MESQVLINRNKCEQGNDYFNYIIPIIFLVVSFIVRSGTFLYTSYDWDESLYVLGARSFLDGNLPYLKVWDHKPPGIFILFTLMLMLFDSSVLAIRVFSCVSVGITAYFLYKIITLNNRHSWFSGLIAGFFYILFSLGNGGQAANTEIFYLFFIVTALFLVLKVRGGGITSRFKKISILFLSSICIGIAASINYIALLYCAVVGFCLLLPDFSESGSFDTGESSMITRLFQAVFLIIGPALVFLVILIVYAINDAIGDLYFANITANKVYMGAGSQPFSPMAFARAFGEQVVGHWLVWVCVFILPIVWRVGHEFSSREKLILVVSLIWIVVAIFGVSTSRLFWSHYFLQFNPALCLIASIVLNKIINPIFDKSKFLAFICLAIIAFGGSYHIIKDDIKKSINVVVNRYVNGVRYFGDIPNQISDYISGNLNHEDYIYIVDYSPIIYDLSHARIPTKYVFPPFLIGNDSKKMIDVNSRKELNNILNCKPKYIIKKNIRPDPSGTDDVFYDILSEYLENNYFFDKSFSGIDIYILKS